MGSTAQAVLGQIISAKPISATEKRPSIPANVDAAVRKALEKLPADRFASAQDFARGLGDEHFRYGEVMAGVAGDFVPSIWNRLTMAMTATTLLLALAFGWSMLRPDPPRAVTRISVQIPEDQAFDPVRGDLALSPDGSLLVYRGVADEGQAQLWARPWDALNATPIRNTEGAAHPAISPDGREVAVAGFNGGPIRVIPLQGGVSRTLADGVLCCLTWGPDGAWVYYSDVFSGLRRVPAGGGSPEILTEVDTAAGDTRHVAPNVLPGGKGVVFVARSPGGFRIQAVDVETGEVKDLTPGTHPRYSATGHLLFIDEDATLLAAPFDVERLELAGAAVPVAEGVAVDGRGYGSFAVSQAGKLVYRTGASGAGVTPVWVERDGTAREIDPGWRTPGAPNNSSLALSPNEDRLAISILDSDGTFDLWVKQLDTGPLSRLTFEGTINRRVTWSPDGQSLTFISDRAGQDDLWTKRADGSGSTDVVLDRESRTPEAFYSPDSTWLVFREGGGGSAFGDIFAIRPGVDSIAVPLAATDFGARSAALSPDGRWLAYVSNEAGREEVYVRPFPDADAGRWLVSPDGGVEPVWAHSGRELFYRNGANELVAVQVSAGSSFAWDRQDVLFSMADYLDSNGSPMYDVSADDQRFVMLRIGVVGSDSELILVENWAEELRERVPN